MTNTAVATQEFGPTEAVLAEYEVTFLGSYYRMHELLMAANLAESLGDKAAVKLLRDRTGRVDAIELYRLTPKGKVEGAKPARLVPFPALATEALKFCQCGHPEGDHYEGSVCMKIEGMYVCGCEHFVQEAAA